MELLFLTPPKMMGISKFILKMLFDTTRRQGFYLHSENYHRRQWSILKKTGIAEIFLATYQNQTLAAFMVFKLKDRLFYPYWGLSQHPP